MDIWLECAFEYLGLKEPGWEAHVQMCSKGGTEPAWLYDM